MIANMTARETTNLYDALGHVHFVAGKGGELVKAAHVREALGIACESLDAIIDQDARGEETPKLGHLTSGAGDPEQVLTKLYAEQVLTDLDAVSPKQALAVRYYYGVGRPAPMTCPEIAEAWGKSTQAVNELVRHGIQTLRRLYGVAVN